MQFTPRAKKALELALREALALRHSHIATEHLLLGLVRDQECAAARFLLDLGADAEKVQAQIVRMLWQDRSEAPRQPAARELDNIV